jgi:hypothetical protein
MRGLFKVIVKTNRIQEAIANNKANVTNAFEPNHEA